MNKPIPRDQAFSGKVYDPVFLCMLGAVILAVGTSVALRVVIAGAGPAAARAADTPASEDNPDSPGPYAPTGEHSARSR